MIFKAVFYAFHETGNHTGVNFGKISASGPVSLAGQLAVSDCCTVAAIPSRNKLHLVDYATGKRVNTLTGHLNQVGGEGGW